MSEPDKKLISNRWRNEIGNGKSWIIYGGKSETPSKQTGVDFRLIGKQPFRIVARLVAQGLESSRFRFLTNKERVLGE
jgi:hypothetical protein